MASDFIQTVPRNYLFRARQTSPLLPELEPSGVPLLYRHIADSAKHSQELGRQVQLLNARVSRTERRAAIDDTTPPEFYPFKIYKPDLSTIGTSGTTFDSNGNPIQIAIDYTVPTNLPTTINPSTDAWRIWAVREGLISRRLSSGPFQGVFPGNNFVTTGPDFSLLYEVMGPDFPGQQGEFNYWGPDRVGIASNEYGTPFDYNPQDGIGVNQRTIPFGVWPIIIPGDADSGGLYSFAIWINSQYFVDSTSVVGAQLMGKRYDTFSGDSGTNTPFPEIQDASTIPIGFITSIGINLYLNNFDPTSLTAYNIQKGDFIARYGTWANNTIKNPNPTYLDLSGTLNIRGDFLNDLNLQHNIFYPGDVVKIESQLTISAVSSGGISTAIHIADGSGNTNTSGIIYSQDLWMQTVVGFTSDPTTDPNWVKISGPFAVTQTDPTPNTT